MNALSPSDTADWTPISGYNKNLKGLPDTPPVSTHTSASTSTTDGGMQNGNRGPLNGNGNPSPPSSVSRSSDGNGLYAPSVAGNMQDSRRAYMMEEALTEHYRVLKNYLAPYLQNERGNSAQNRARDKLLRLTAIQFEELSTDVYDELLRREDERRRAEDRRRVGPGAPPSNVPQYLLPKQIFHFKRNQARQKLSTLPTDRFRQLATDVFYELERRYPKFAAGERSVSRAGSIGSTRGPNYPPPPRTASRGAPDMQRNGPLPGYRNNSPFDGQSGIQPGLDTPPNEYGRPLPKNIQSNTIIPNKGMLVEDDDDDEVPRDLNGRAPEDNSAELKSQVSQLEQKVDELQGELLQKSNELEKIQSSSQGTNSVRTFNDYSCIRSNLTVRSRLREKGPSGRICGTTSRPRSRKRRT
jgi:hypothetical protein